MNPTVPEALEKLAAHGTARQIAEHLRQEHILGNRRGASSCVVAAYLHKVEAAADHPQIMPSSCMTSPELDRHPTGRATWTDENWMSHVVALPAEVNDLACMFDRGEFPELEVEGSWVNC